MSQTTLPKSSGPVTHATIQAFVQHYLASSKTHDYETASRIEAAGFTSAANVRLANLHEAFLGADEGGMRAQYEERYPASVFLSWEALHHTLRALELWFEPARFYAGAVPPEQLPWIEAFERHPDDAPQADDLLACVMSGGGPWGAERRRRLALIMNPTPSIQETHHGFTNRLHTQVTMTVSPGAIDMLRARLKDLRRGLFVVAPRDAFTTSTSAGDWIFRAQKDINEALAPTVIPNDPLVVSPVKGGVIVVAAWGDEAAYLNEITNTLKLT